MPAKQTFEGFLKRYCVELSGENTISLSKLCRLAASEIPRLAEPLFLLALARKKGDYLVGLSCNTRLENDYRIWNRKAQGFDSALEFAESEHAPARIRSVAQAFHAQDDALNADRRIVALMRDKTLAALSSSAVTRYRLCKDLGLNKGNVYAYLAGDTTKVSRSTARRIMEYVL